MLRERPHPPLPSSSEEEQSEPPEPHLRRRDSYPPLLPAGSPKLPWCSPLLLHPASSSSSSSSSLPAMVVVALSSSRASTVSPRALLTLRFILEICCMALADLEDEPPPPPDMALAEDPDMPRSRPPPPPPPALSAPLLPRRDNCFELLGDDAAEEAAASLSCLAVA